MKKIDYQFVAVPLNLFYCLDNNLRSMLFTLIQISTYKESETDAKGKTWDGWFLAANRILADNSNLSENLVRATLDALFQKGIISILSAGKGKGKNTPPNKIRINWERIKEYDKESIEDCIQDPTLAINTPRYSGSHYQPSYLKQDKTVITETVMVDEMVNNRVKIEDINNDNKIYNINNKEKIENKENKKSLEENNNINIYIDSSFDDKEESITIGEYQMRQTINGFSHVKNLDDIRSQVRLLSTRLMHIPNEKRQKYVDKVCSTLRERCKELDIDYRTLQC